MQKNYSGALTLLLFTSISAQGQPVFYWPLNEAAGNVAYAATGGSNGLVSGNTFWQPTGGHHAGALRFYGNDARVDLGPCDVTGGAGDELSIACWFKPEIISGTERILMAKTVGPGEGDHVWSLSLVNNTGARFRLRANGTVHTAEIPPSSIFSNTWYHLAATYDGASLRVFLNGSLTAFGAASGSIGYHPQAPASLGNRTDNGAPFYGSLDDVRIYGQALTESEVIDLVIGEVSTGIEEPQLLLGGDGRLTLPIGKWETLRMHDLSGRLVGSAVIAGQFSPFIPLPASGTYLFCLQGGSGQHARAIQVP